MRLSIITILISFVLGTLSILSPENWLRLICSFLPPSEQELQCRIVDQRFAIQQAKDLKRLEQDPLIGKSEDDILRSWGAPILVQCMPQSVENSKNGEAELVIEKYWAYGTFSVVLKNKKCESWFSTEIYH